MVDESLLIRQLGDPAQQRKAFETVVNTYSEKLYWQIRRIVLNHDDANDVLQNVFVKAWSHLDDFRHDSKLSTWLFRIAVNESLDFMRKQKREAGVWSLDDAESVGKMLRADDYFDGDDAQLMLQQAISTLPPVQRTVFNMRYFDEMKYSDLSKILNTSEGALKASYHIAVQKILSFFKQNN